MVLTAPAGVTARSLWLTESTTTKAPLGSTPTWRGELNLAAVPAALSAKPRLFHVGEPPT